MPAPTVDPTALETLSATQDTSQRDKLHKIARRTLNLLDALSIRLKRRMIELDRTDPDGHMLPKEPEFRTMARLVTTSIAEIESLRIQREKIRRPEPVGNPEDDFQLALAAVKALPPERLETLLDEINTAVSENREEDKFFGETSHTPKVLK